MNGSYMNSFKKKIITRTPLQSDKKIVLMQKFSNIKQVKNSGIKTEGIFS